jgi:flagellin-like hook-associated protein FlgL
MSSNVNLTASVRANLSALQDIASMQTTTSQRLSTGKKVSSALDNPVNFFTAAGLTNRSTQLTGLLDGISNGIQTVQAANKGLTSITSLVQQLQSTVAQARQDTTGSVTPGTAISAAASNTSTSTNSKLTFTVGTQNIDIDTYTSGTPTTSATITGVGATLPPTAAKSFTVQASGYNGGAAKTINLTGSEATVDDVVTKINADLGAGATIQATKVGTQVKLTNTTGQQITVGGSNEADVFGTAATTSTDGVVGSGGVKTVDDIVTAINSNGLLSNKVKAEKDASNNLKLTNLTTDDVTVKGFSSTALSGNASLSTVLTKGTAALSATRQSLANQFNSLISQLDKLSGDSGFNGVNLLQGDHLKVTFNEKTGASSNSLDISLKKSDNTDFGVVNSFNLGIGQAATTSTGAGTDFKSNSALDTLTDTLTTALTTVQSQSSALGANLSVVQTRQDFTKGIIDVLQTGAGNLTDADMNAEAANSQALSTRQSIGISALSLSNTAAQGVLQLLR